MAQVGRPYQARIKVRYFAPDGEKWNKVRLNATQIFDVSDPDPKAYDKRVRFPATTEWSVREIGVFELPAGDNLIKVYCGEGGIEVDTIIVEPV